ncbi:MAG: cell division protein FtsA [Candidatus Liptonbacteria bacterium RIFCSPLOWO2_01_FULL_52_25]|uniref:Cell division protein FtsA n=1 Tax=Candidatus Liptonbacteria bacterium RIFCSPLOWO2_01_FULL_52_25 TaxID=1798650 RepID=A0A1G2CDC9_9BACT|nr:MAG: cell division protein FtsA [Candidatus Liptonbacteria bacterium RIFCSPLOWO2_01_FULL_52_25]
MSSTFITGLDIGTHALKAVVAENVNGKPVVRLVLKEPAQGLRRGAIVDLAEASRPINKIVGEIKKFSRAAAKNMYVNIGTQQVKSQASKGIVAVSRADTEIYPDDIERAVKASQAVNLGPNRTIIHTVTREFIVDGVGDIMEPLGLSGSRLEVNSLIIDAFAPHVKNIMRAVELAGGEVAGLVLTPLVAARSALSKRQKDLGVVVVDLGAGTTGMSVYEENKLIGVAKFPVGGASVSNDLALTLKIPVHAAENLKLNYGYALSRDVSQKEMADLNKIFPEANHSVSRKFVAEVIQARLEEIFEFVSAELRLIGKHGKLPGGVVLVGGGAKLPGLTELAKHELKLTSQIGVALEDEWHTEQNSFSEYLEDPEFVNALGLALWGVDGEEWKSGKGFWGGWTVRNALAKFRP